MGSCTAGGAYVPAMCDENIIVREQGTIFLAGPPLVRAATGEEVSAEELGGGDVHTRLSGVSDHLADDDEHALAIARSIFESLGPRTGLEYALQQAEPEDPYYDPREIYGVVSGDTRKPYEVRELIARLVDGSRMHEFKPRYGDHAGDRLRAHLRLSGRNHRQQRRAVQRIGAEGDAFHRALLRAAHPAALFAEHHRLHGRQALRAGRNRQGRGQDGQRGGQRAGAQVHRDNRRVQRRRKLRDVRAGVLAADAFHVAQRAHLGDGRRAGGQHAADGQARPAEGAGPDDDARRSRPSSCARRWQKYEHESSCYFSSARLWDDGVLDPLETRAMLALGIAASLNAAIPPATSFGVFRM